MRRVNKINIMFQYFCFSVSFVKDKTVRNILLLSRDSLSPTLADFLDSKQ